MIEGPIGKADLCEFRAGPILCYFIIFLWMSIQEISLPFFRFTASTIRAEGQPSSSGYPIPNSKIKPRKSRINFLTNLRRQQSRAELFVKRKPKVDKGFSPKLIHTRAAHCHCRDMITKLKHPKYKISRKSVTSKVLLIDIHFSLELLICLLCWIERWLSPNFISKTDKMRKLWNLFLLFYEKLFKK